MILFLYYYFCFEFLKMNFRIIFLCFMVFLFIEWVNFKKVVFIWIIIGIRIVVLILEFYGLL